MANKHFGPYSFEVGREAKVLFPKDGFSKADLMTYYESVSSYMLRQVSDRPLTLQRFPDGIGKEGFFQQQASDYFPDWIQRTTLTKEDGEVTHVVCSNKATLSYLASQACITFHCWLSRIDKIRRPDRMIFDLDPPGRSFEPVASAALIVRDYLDGLGLTSYAMSTGSRGLHVVVPLNRTSDFDVTRATARAIAGHLASSHPHKLTVEQRKDKRKGRLYLDVMRNAYGQTAVAPYSVRARNGAPVAVPLHWHEVESGTVEPRTFNITNTLDRLADTPDPWLAISRHGQSLSRVARALGVS